MLGGQSFTIFFVPFGTNIPQKQGGRSKTFLHTAKQGGTNICTHKVGTMILRGEEVELISAWFVKKIKKAIVLLYSLFPWETSFNVEGVGETVSLVW